MRFDRATQPRLRVRGNVGNRQWIVVGGNPRTCVREISECDERYERGGTYLYVDIRPNSTFLILNITCRVRGDATGQKLRGVR